jgi:pimeloyl-ACP methyl ester carboxylesterase
MTETDELTVQAGGVPVPVRRVGTGPNVLFMHGVYVNGTVWDDVVALLQSAMTCWIPTLPLGGHHQPMGADWQPTLDSIGDMTLDLIDELGLSDVTVVGNDSGGGFVLLALASDRPALGRISRLVLTNCDSYDHLPPTSFNPLIELCRSDPEAAKGQLQPMLFTEAGRAAFLQSISNRQLSTERVNAMFGRETVLDDVVKVTATLKPSPEQLAMAWLTKVTIPTDLVWGDADLFFPPSDCDRLAAALPNTTVTWIPDAKTYTQLDAPQELARVISRGR